jgi:hypothetical protein
MVLAIFLSPRLITLEQILHFVELFKYDHKKQNWNADIQN